MEKHRVAISLLNWNGLELTTACVTSLVTHHIPADIFILDNGSVNNEAEVLKKKFPEITVERSPVNLGFAGGNNYWIRRLKANYDYILLLNQDTVATGDFITPLITVLDAHHKVAVAGPSGGKISFWTGKVYSDQGDDCIIGYCCVLRSKTIQDIGLLTEQYFAYYEEVDWCWRAKQKGYHCQVVPVTTLIHHKVNSYRTYYNARNMVWFMKRFASPLQLSWFFCYYFTVFWLERLHKGSKLSDLYRAAKDGWL